MEDTSSRAKKRSRKSDPRIRVGKFRFLYITVKHLKLKLHHANTTIDVELLYMENNVLVSKLVIGQVYRSNVECVVSLL